MDVCLFPFARIGKSKYFFAGDVRYLKRIALTRSAAASDNKCIQLLSSRSDTQDNVYLKC